MLKAKVCIPGVLLCFVIAAIGEWISKYLPNFGAVSITILVGVIFGNFILSSDKFSKGINFTEKSILPIAIALLGVELQFNVLSNLGFKTVIFIIVLITSTIFSALLIGRLFGYNSSFSFLLGAGNAICGSSAIAAVKPLVKCKDEEVGLSIGIVNFLGTLGIFLMPFIATILGFKDNSSGILIGSTLQAIGQVVASGFSVNDNVGNIALIVKMTRVLMIGPVVIIVSILTSFFQNKTSTKPAKFKIPLFIIGFIFFSFLASINLFNTYYIKLAGKILLLISMAAIGTKINFAFILKNGLKSVFMGVLVVCVQLIIVLSFLKGVY
jgi:uncharacterized integral membrane protein (TIGR00698 family)